jgi:hypothetical protein
MCRFVHGFLAYVFSYFLSVIGSAAVNTLLIIIIIIIVIICKIYLQEYLLQNLKRIYNLKNYAQTIE